MLDIVKPALSVYTGLADKIDKIVGCVPTQFIYILSQILNQYFSTGGEYTYML